MKLEEVKNRIKNVGGLQLSIRNKKNPYYVLTARYSSNGIAKLIASNRIDITNDILVVDTIQEMTNQLQECKDNRLTEWLKDNDAKRVPEFPDYYCSKDGRVFSTRLRWTEVKPTRCKNKKYLYICLWKGDRRITTTLHQVIAMTYLGYIRPSRLGALSNETIVCDHIDNNPLNNSLDNLQLITHGENIAKDKKLGKSGIRGVVQNSKSGRYYTRVKYKGEKFSIANANNDSIEELENLGIIYATATDYINELNLNDWIEANKDTKLDIQFAA